MTVPAGTGASLPRTLPDAKEWPRISIVTPSFNQGRFIEDTIQSVLDQDYPNVEHVVVDGGSTDDTPAVISRYRDRLAVVICEPDRGQSDAINKGMARTTGDILAWLNSDDRLAPGALASVALALHTSGADMVAGVCEVERDGEIVERHLTSCADGPLPLPDLLDLEGCWLAGQFFYQPEVFFTREVWTRAGGCVDEHSRYSMDYDLWLRMAAAGATLKVIGRPLARFRLHAGQKTADPRHYQSELPEARRRFLEAKGLPSPSSRPRRVALSKPLRIVFFNDIGFQYGAGIAHGRLAAAMTMAGHTVLPVSARPSADPSPLSTADQAKCLRAMAGERPDVVLVGNLHGAGIPALFLSDVARRWPTAFVLHDLWLLTGRCPYTGGCEKLRSGCDATCPTPTEYPPLPPEEIAGAWATKRALLASKDAPLLLANSDWTARQVRDALGPLPAAADLQRITLGAGPEFIPHDRLAARRLLGLPSKPFLVLLSAASLSDQRKGCDHLLQALSLLNSTDVELVLTGWSEAQRVPDIRVHRFTYVHEPKTLALIYSASDLFVGPSLQESLGQVFLEAAACGVPSVGYRVGGVPEAIRDGISGVLLEEHSPAALAGAIDRLRNDEQLRGDLGRWARVWFENERTLEAVYHSVHVALRRQSDLTWTIIGRKISFGPSPSPSTEHDPRLQPLLTSPTPGPVLSGPRPWSERIFRVLPKTILKRWKSRPL